MKRSLFITIFLYSAMAFGQQCVPSNTQSCTPNVQLALPFLNAPNWNVPLIQNFTLLDQLLSGTGSISPKVSNLNNIIFVDGVKYGTCDAAVAALGSGAGTIIIPSIYAGPECSGLSFNATDGSNYNLWRGSNLITIQDLRASTNKAYGINYGGTTLGSLAKLAVTQSVTSPATTSSAVLGTEQVTGNLGLSGGSYAGGTFEVDVEGPLTGISTNIVQALTGQFAVRSTGQTLPLVVGVEGGGGIDRTGITTNITTAVGVQGDQATNASPGTATITDTFGVRGIQSTVGTRNNFAISAEGDMMISNTNGLFVENGGSAALKVLGFTTSGTTFSRGIGNDGSGLKHKRFGATTATTASANAVATTTYSWTTAFADTSYTPICSPEGTVTGTPVYQGVISFNTSGVTVQVMAATAAASSFGGIYCHAVHD